MERKKLLNTLIQILAFLMFIYQMQNSIGIYIRAPIVQENSVANLDEITMPLIYVCEDGQFDYHKSAFYGYRTYKKFFNGNLKDYDYISWKGKDGNKSYKVLQTELYNADYENFSFKSGETVEKLEKTETEMMFFAPHGFCKKLKKTEKFTSILSTTRSTVYLVDPSYKSNLKIVGSHSTSQG